MTYTNPSSSGSAVTAGDTSTSSDSWFEAIARAWANALDNEAQKLTGLSDQLNSSGTDQPSIETMLSAESQRMNFLANAEANSVTSLGGALQTMARKQ